jgi:Transglycosylase SLT domain
MTQVSQLSASRLRALGKAAGLDRPRFENAAGVTHTWSTTADGLVVVDGNAWTLATDAVTQAALSRTLGWSSLAAPAAAAAAVPLPWVLAFVFAESGGNPSATSKDGGKGLLQLTSASLTAGLTTAQAMDPATNLRIGAGYLGKLARAGALDLVKLASAYNGGTGTGTQPHAKASDPWGLVESAGYIERVVRAQNTIRSSPSSPSSPAAPSDAGDVDDTDSSGPVVLVLGLVLTKLMGWW